MGGVVPREHGPSRRARAALWRFVALLVAAAAWWLWAGPSAPAAKGHSEGARPAAAPSSHVPGLAEGPVPPSLPTASVPASSRADTESKTSAGTALTGRVTEEPSGSPIAGARVQAWIDELNEVPPLTAISDSEGHFALDGVAGAPTVRLVATADMHAPATVTLVKGAAR